MTLNFYPLAAYVALMRGLGWQRPALGKYLVVVVMGILTYAIVTAHLNVLILPETELTAIRPSVVIPMLIGFLFGPLAGFITGFMGNVLGDAISFGGFYWTWDIGNGIMGAIPGLAYIYLNKEKRTGSAGRLWSVPLAAVSALVGMGIAALLELLFHTAYDTAQEIWTAFFSAAVTDAINGMVLLPLLLWAYAYLTGLRQKIGPPEGSERMDGLKS